MPIRPTKNAHPTYEKCPSDSYEKCPSDLHENAHPNYKKCPSSTYEKCPSDLRKVPIRPTKKAHPTY